MIRSTLLIMVALCFAVSMVYAQEAPGGGNRPAGGMGGNRGGMFGGGQQNTAQMEITANGIFVLDNGVLAKFDPTSLKQAGVSLELFGPLAERPTMSTPPTDAEQQAMRTWMMDYMKRTSPPTMLAQGDELLIVMGNSYFRVNQLTMAIDATQATLITPSTEAQPQNPRPMMNSKPVLLLAGNMLYILLNGNLVKVNAETGAVLCSNALPKEMTPPAPNFGFGGMGGGGRGGRRGGGGGGGGNNAAPAQ